VTSRTAVVGWVERSDTHQRRCAWRWVSSLHPSCTAASHHLHAWRAEFPPL